MTTMKMLKTIVCLFVFFVYVCSYMNVLVENRWKLAAQSIVYT